MVETISTTNGEGLETDVIIDGVNYRIDLIVLEQLDDKGEATEKYTEWIYGNFLSSIEKEENIIQGEIVQLIQLKAAKEKYQELVGKHNELIEKLQFNNQRLAALIQQTENILNPQYLESVSGN